MSGVSGVDRLVAGEDPAAQEAVARVVGRELEVAVEVAVADPLLEAFDDVGGLAERDDASTLTRGRSRSCTRVMMPNRP